jgi:hypothetical protein
MLWSLTSGGHGERGTRIMKVDFLQRSVYKVVDPTSKTLIHGHAGTRARLDATLMRLASTMVTSLWACKSTIQ